MCSRIKKMKNIVLYIVLLALTSCKTQQVAITSIEWKLVQLNSEDVASVDPPLTLLLNETQMKISGFAGCNRFFGSYQLGESNLQFSGLGSTKMYCQDKSATEDKYLKALNEVQSFKIEGDKLVLLAGEKTILEFKK